MNDSWNYSVTRLINEIEVRPTIWDCRVKEYSDRALKREAWEEVCATFVTNYYLSSDAERSFIVATLQRKWKSVRDAFIRDLKKMANPLSGIKPTKPYAYYDNLLFLKPVCEVRAKKDEDRISHIETIGYDEKDDSDNDNNSRSSASFSENKGLSAQPTPKRKQTEERQDTEEREDIEESVFNMLADHIKNKRAKNEREEPDRQFLLSLLPDLQSIDPRIKFDLKYEIMTVVKRYKDESLKYHQV